MTALNGPTAEDVLIVSRVCRRHLETYIDLDWSIPAGGLEWSCRETVAHISDALGFYTVHMACRATEWLKFDVVPHSDASNLHLVRLLEAMGMAFADVLQATPADARAYHHSGMWDRSGFAAMGCLETLVHTGDVAAGLGIAYDPPRDACRRTLDRLCTGAPRDEDPWQVLWWASGRGELPDRRRLGPKWEEYWLKEAEVQ
jgi:hypothetical protein